jgi:hypothetical protein
MNTFTIPQNDEGELLFKEDLEIIKKDIRILRGEMSSEGRDEGEVSLFLTRKNWVAVRKPKPENLVKYLLEQKHEIHPDIVKEIKEGYDFYHIALICSFLPDPACKFTWARLTVKMQCMPKQENLEVQEKALVCDMYPDEIHSEVKIERTFKVSGGLVYKFIEFKPESEIKSEFLVYQPEIISVGRNGSTFYWDFKESVQKSIYGDKVLFAIIKKPKDSQVVGQFEIDTRVETLKGIIRVPFSAKRKRKVVNILYEIC